MLKCRDYRDHVLVYKPYTIRDLKSSYCEYIWCTLQVCDLLREWACKDENRADAEFVAAHVPLAKGATPCANWADYEKLLRTPFEPLPDFVLEHVATKAGVHIVLITHTRWNPPFVCNMHSKLEK